MKALLRKKRSIWWVVLLSMSLVGALSACWPDRLTGKACDYEHPCFDGFRCQDGICVDASTSPPPTSLDGGVEGSAAADAGG